ncbi:MAG TPA: sigma 54-interacting transcriptional regulator [Myxococcota bacterium]
MHAQLLAAATSPMRPLIAELDRLAATDTPVLLSGETGTGKEVLARHLHDQAGRAGPFVAVHCAAIPEALIEAELFGHARGAFAGADRRRDGRVALAAGGTLFLDEVAALSLPLQQKLLRLLVDGVYEAVGDVDAVRADVRIVAASTSDLLAAVEAGRFRKDLYYRLAVCALDVPALADRGDDIGVMFRALLDDRGDHRPVDDAVVVALRAYRWPGNVRELMNVVERLRICAAGPRITVADLPASIRAASAVGVVPVTLPPMPVATAISSIPTAADDVAFNVNALRAASGGYVALPVVDEERAEREGLFVEPVTRPLLPVNLTELLRDLENDYIDAALEQTRGNRQAAAALLGLQRTTLVEKLKRREAARSISSEGAPVEERI